MLFSGLSSMATGSFPALRPSETAAYAMQRRINVKTKDASLPQRMLRIHKRQFTEFTKNVDVQDAYWRMLESVMDVGTERNMREILDFVHVPKLKALLQGGCPGREGAATLVASPSSSPTTPLPRPAPFPTPRSFGI